MAWWSKVLKRANFWHERFAQFCSINGRNEFPSRTWYIKNSPKDCVRNYSRIRLTTEAKPKSRGVSSAGGCKKNYGSCFKRTTFELKIYIYVFSSMMQIKQVSKDESITVLSNFQFWQMNYHHMIWNHKLQCMKRIKDFRDLDMIFDTMIKVLGFSKIWKECFIFET